MSELRTPSQDLLRLLDAAQERNEAAFHEALASLIERAARGGMFPNVEQVITDFRDELIENAQRKART